MYHYGLLDLVSAVLHVITDFLASVAALPSSVRGYDSLT